MEFQSELLEEFIEERLSEKYDAPDFSEDLRDDYLKQFDFLRELGKEVSKNSIFNLNFDRANRDREESNKKTKVSCGTRLSGGK